MQRPNASGDSIDENMDGGSNISAHGGLPSCQSKYAELPEQVSSVCLAPQSAVKKVLFLHLVLSLLQWACIVSLQKQLVCHLTHSCNFLQRPDWQAKSCIMAVV